MDDTQAPGWPLVGMTAEEAAKALRVDVRTVRDAIRSGGLPARLVGKGWRIDVDALKHWLATGSGEGRKGADASPEGEDA